MSNPLHSNPPAHAPLILLVEQNRWSELAAATEDVTFEQVTSPELFFFRGMAMTKTGHPFEAIPFIKKGLTLVPNSGWGNKLLFDALRENQNYQEAFETFANYIRTPGNHEDEKAWYVQCAAELGFFDIASTVNETRSSIVNAPKLPRFALAAQCFCKADTLEKVFESLCDLHDAQQFGLVVLQDSPVESTNPTKYSSACEHVRAVVSGWQTKLATQFFSVEYLINERNLGTAPTCRRLLDIVSSKYEGFLFIEDDCVLAPSALDWASYHLTNSIDLDRAWFVTCESSYFNKEDRELPGALRSRLESLAKRRAIRNSFVEYDFVPSTCFGTTSEIWKLCASVRSFTRGPESLNRFLVQNHRKTIGPVVPRSADIGMLHQLGYSVERNGLANVRERKSTYYLPQEPFDDSRCEPYRGNKDLLFEATSKLEESALNELDELFTNE